MSGHRHGVPEVVELMQRFVTEGKVRCWGISTLSPEDALALLAAAGVGAFRLSATCLDWRAIDTGLPCQAAWRGIGIIAPTPRASGFLAGDAGADTVLSRQRPPQQMATRSDRHLDGGCPSVDVDSVDLADRPQNRVALALRFCLSRTELPG
ncbi:aldo/keto reductase [Bradyrhizobium sp. DASA03076]|uniref:aldo/keto reductase n=1 Tax=Bradyrhizobium sp. BLXBL-03 TaxID=3395916 RepID=UPI003F707362